MGALEIQKSSQPLKPNQCWRDAGAPSSPLQPSNWRPTATTSIHCKTNCSPGNGSRPIRGKLLQSFPFLRPNIPPFSSSASFHLGDVGTKDWINRGILCRGVRRFLGKTARGAFSFIFLFLLLSLLFCFEIHSQFSEWLAPLCVSFLLLLFLLGRSRNESADVSRKCESKRVFGEFSSIFFWLC